MTTNKNNTTNNQQGDNGRNQQHGQSSQEVGIEDGASPRPRRLHSLYQNGRGLIWNVAVAAFVFITVVLAILGFFTLPAFLDQARKADPTLVQPSAVTDVGGIVFPVSVLVAVFLVIRSFKWKKRGATALRLVLFTVLTVAVVTGIVGFVGMLDRARSVQEASGVGAGAGLPDPALVGFLVLGLLIVIAVMNRVIKD